ncbi:DUF6515 family protein [Maribacter halichondriae]|uniref:DUF6515 family protein n=1 Tax=Maribacter halichondriae TaxID=2980554 RepID=UPI00235896DF|nr:DUF6515 family protein [Maribacter sp. Hal144]
MKNFKVMFIALALFGTLGSANANSSVEKVSLENVMVVKSHPSKVFIHKGKKYHFRNGNWYIKRGRKYIAVRPPVGIKVRHLPRGNKVVYINGRKLYKYKGIWYKKNGRGFVVVNI